MMDTVWFLLADTTTPRSTGLADALPAIALLVTAGLVALCETELGGEVRPRIWRGAAAAGGAVAFALLAARLDAPPAREIAADGLARGASFLALAVGLAATATATRRVESALWLFATALATFAAQAQGPVLAFAALEGLGLTAVGLSAPGARIRRTALGRHALATILLLPGFTLVAGGWPAPGMALATAGLFVRATSASRTAPIAMRALLGVACGAALLRFGHTLDDSGTTALVTVLHCAAIVGLVGGGLRALASSSLRGVGGGAATAGLGLVALGASADLARAGTAPLMLATATIPWAIALAGIGAALASETRRRTRAGQLAFAVLLLSLAGAPPFAPLRALVRVLETLRTSSDPTVADATAVVVALALCATLVAVLRVLARERTTVAAQGTDAEPQPRTARDLAIEVVMFLAAAFCLTAGVAASVFDAAVGLWVG